MKFKKILTLLTFFSFSALSFAGDYIVGQYRNVRSMGMGGTNVTTALDEAALIYNPALLKILKKHKLLIPGFADFANSNSKDLYNDFNDFLDDLDKVNGDQNTLYLLQAYIDGTTLSTVDINGDGIVNDSDIVNANKRKIPNEYLQMQMSTFAGFITEGFGFGVFGTFRSNQIGLTGNKVNPSVTVNADGTLEIPVGLAFKIFDKINLGASVRYIQSAKVKKELYYTDISDLTQDGLSTEGELSILGAEKAQGIGVNLGAVVELNKLNIGIGLQDPFTKLQTSKYVLKNGSTTEYEEQDLEKKSLPTILSVGISNKPYNDEGKKNKLFWAVEMQNLLSKDLNDDGHDDTNLYKKLHLGAEYTVFESRLFDLSLRGGLNQGYPTVGTSISLAFLEVEYAYFTEELGSHLGMNKNEVHSLALNARF